MSDEPLKPLTEDPQTTAEKYIDPFGPGPDEVPDPMPDELESEEVDAQWEAEDPMEGDAPTS